MRTALLIDTESIYHQLKLRYDNKLDYQLFLDYLKGEFNYDVQIKHAYGNQNVKPFMSVLQALGFQLNFKQGKNWSVEIILKIASIIGKIDCVVLATSDPIYRPLIPWVEAHGVKIHIISCNIPKALFELGLSTEIPENLCETPNATKQMVVSTDSTSNVHQ